MIYSIILTTFLMSKPSTDAPQKRDNTKYVVHVEYAEKEKDLMFNKFVGFYYA